MKPLSLYSHETKKPYDPTTIEERRKVASQCEEGLKYGIRTYVDEMDDGTNKAYAAWPTRLYLVGTDGSVAYAGGLGPFGFKPAELGAAIDAYLRRENVPGFEQTLHAAN